MPFMQTALSSMNTAFSADAMQSFQGREAAEPFHVDSGASLSDALRRVPGLDLSDAVAEFIDSWPSGLQAVVRSVIHHNFTREATVPITFAWKPGYDFSVEVFDVHDTKTSRGGITMIFTSRYPDDAHPLTMGQ
jgi:hypothetical protein